MMLAHLPGATPGGIINATSGSIIAPGIGVTNSTASATAAAAAAVQTQSQLNAANMLATWPYSITSGLTEIGLPTTPALGPSFTAVTQKAEVRSLLAKLVH
ncbi:unnamed protein product [Protopolystoma xenopodis]|uniref:Uncharacterized protein n=1 Tax=Protopolystoma xenopodis TaxID=117903 RepID=A0A3S5BXM6_9PLAT|nr:unnamed protein product [Protopolystoma xenopodis]